MSDTRGLTDPKVIAEDGCSSAGTGGVSALLASCVTGVLEAVRCNKTANECTAPGSWGVVNKPLPFVDKENEPVEVDFDWLASSVPSRDVKQVLLVFPRADDQQSEIIGRVARKLGWSVAEARNAEEAGELANARPCDLAIVDRRNAQRSQEADDTCRILVDTSNSSVFVVALVKKSRTRFFGKPRKKDLKKGSSKMQQQSTELALLECSHEGILTNELIGTSSGLSQAKRSQATGAHLLYLAVEQSRDVVHVTNDRHVILFANSASERSFGYRPDELLGRSLEEFVAGDNFALIDHHLQRSKEFEGPVAWRKRNRTVVHVACRIVLVTPNRDKGVVYHVCFYEAPAAVESISSRTSFEHYSPRGSLQSSIGGRQSLELHTWSKTRRSTATIAKLHNLPLESPITKVVAVLTSALADSESPEVREQIDTAIEILKKAELYSPRLRDGDPLPVSDPVTADLLGALISVTTNDPRQSVALASARQTQLLKILNSSQNPTRAKVSFSPQASQELEALLETGFEWGFDIFKLETLTGKRPLFYLGMSLMSQFKVAERLECDERVLQNWLTIVEANYNSQVSYHNSTHATDVLQAIARFMRSERLRAILDPLDEVAALLAAAAHDIGHPGKSSQFLCNASDHLAILYNDLTVLESHHSALTFKLTLSDDKVNVLKNLNREVYKFMRQNVIDMILATEMTKHFEHLAKFVNVCSNRIGDHAESLDVDSDSVASIFLLPENVTMAKRMMIKCADVSNPTRPMRLYVEWTRRIAEEYFDQTDEEKKRMMPVVMPMFDRISCSIPKSQIGFVDYIINDMMEAWDAFIDMPEMIGNMRLNYDKWKKFDEQGVTTLDDIKKVQQNPEYQLYGRSSSS
ncbi:high affinity cAMP-specific and IBMX-insensitive 3',5'-cyclic phosphodiesterase 8-like [Copidosoma floridanum]|uniref:high affinity cAMP-specific and IBMX-insensitive 3',5'-cyclic phosphodiesterase 8-like n=1 Tax=Copidosoma floridanum TaxID=29053 RepID=UPI000C6FBD4A|nr:high affinity cAMP-specific and IBMX-insensitive 3',5'-cyclic phosphodiesterase 8-like [Copidosoma floridanum]